MTSRLALLIPATLLAACAPGEFAPAQNDYTPNLDQLLDEDFSDERVLIGYGQDLEPRVRFAGSSLRLMDRWSAVEVGMYAVPAGEDVRDVIESLRASGEFAWVEPDLVRHTSYTPNDPYLSYQWHLTAIDASTAWDTTTGSGAIVAVLDTGLHTGGTDTPNTVTGWDFAYDDSNPSDGDGHGTHVSGTIAQASNNAIGVAGVAYSASIMPVKVLDDSGSGYSSDIIDGLVYAADNGADVINMSLGSSFGSTSEESAVNYAWSAGVYIAAASGNGGSATSIDYPARYANAVAVGATRYDSTRASYSNRGSQLELMAPGGDTSVDQNGDGYADGVLQETHDGFGSFGYYFFQGTSMATPHVAGTAALLASLGASNTETRTILQNTAVDLGTAGWDSTYGYGLIDAAAAVQAYGPAVDADVDGYDTTSDCNDSDASINPGATEVCGDGIDQDCSGADLTCPDTTAPVISGISHTASRKSVRVDFTTNELATGRVCLNTGDCKTTALSTTHRTTHKRSGATTYTITATDAAGNVSTSGPFSL